jgi:hypothetical protein
MANKQGSYEQLQIWLEAARGTTPTTCAGHLMPLYDYSVGLSEPAPTDVYELNGNPQPAQPGKGVISFGGSLTVPIDEVAIGLWLKLLLPAYSKTGTTPVVHTFKATSTDPDPWGMELGNSGATKYDVIPGCAVTGMHVAASKDPAKATATVDVIGLLGGAPDLNNSSSVDGTPSAYTSNRMNLFPSIVKIATSASALIERFSFDIVREVTADHVMNGTRYPVGGSFGNLSVSGQMTALWDDADTILGLAMSSAGVDAGEKVLELDLTAVTATYGLNFYFDECAIYLPNPPGLGGRGTRRLTVGFKAYYQDDSDASAVRAVLSNGTADYEAIFV